MMSHAALSRSIACIVTITQKYHRNTIILENVTLGKYKKFEMMMIQTVDIYSKTNYVRNCPELPGGVHVKDQYDP